MRAHLSKVEAQQARHLRLVRAEVDPYVSGKVIHKHNTILHPMLHTRLTGRHVQIGNGKQVAVRALERASGTRHHTGERLASHLAAPSVDRSAAKD
jgi:hypothetical protein